MTDVFLSYKREDEGRVGRLVRALEAKGLTVWWDRSLLAGEHWRKSIEDALADARCVVVTWTEAAVGAGGGFVKDEAGRAAARGILVPVLLDRVSLPLGFGEIQAIDLTHWRGSTSDPFFQDLVAAVRAKIEGRPAPAPRGPVQRAMRRFTWGGLGAAATAVVATFVTNGLGLQDKVCGIGWGQPALSDLCGAADLGNRPSKSERIAWAGRRRNDCDALREHLRRFPDGVLSTRARTMLEGRTRATDDVFAPAKRQLSLFVSTDATSSPTEAVARAGAIERGRSQAGRLCRDFAASGLYRFNGADVEATTWDCRQQAGRWLCTFEGRASCALDERKVVEREQCVEAGSDAPGM